MVKGRGGDRGDPCKQSLLPVLRTAASLLLVSAKGEWLEYYLETVWPRDSVPRGPLLLFQWSVTSLRETVL